MGLKFIKAPTHGKNPQKGLFWIVCSRVTNPRFVTAKHFSWQCTINLPHLPQHSSEQTEDHIFDKNDPAILDIWSVWLFDVEE